MKYGDPFEDLRVSWSAGAAVPDPADGKPAAPPADDEAAGAGDEAEDRPATGGKAQTPAPTSPAAGTAPTDNDAESGYLLDPGKDRLSYQLTVAKNKTKVWLSIEDYPIDLETAQILEIINKALARHNVVEGLDRDFLDNELPKLVGNRALFLNRLIAKTEPAHDGVDCKLEFKVPRPTKGFLVRPDGTCDWKNRDMIKSVKGGETLLIRHDPVPPVDGRSVFGLDLQGRPGRDVFLMPIRNVDIRDIEGGQEAIATSDGQVVYDLRRASLGIRVSPVLELPSHVDYGTGNIFFKGSIIVKGNVCNGFQVVASGNITVNGMIEPGTCVTAGGDIWVKKGVLGAHKEGEDPGLVKAFGNIQALYAEHANLEAEGDILLRSSLNSQLRANGDVIIEKNLVGGMTMGLRSVTAAEIGNTVNVATIVQTGVSFSTVNRLDLIVKILADLKKKHEGVAKNLTFVSKKHALEPTEKTGLLLAGLEARCEALGNQIRKLEMKKADYAIEVLAEKKSTISGTVFYPGVRLLVHSSPYVVTGKPVGNATFYLDAEEQVRFDPYIPGKTKPAGGTDPSESAP